MKKQLKSRTIRFNMIMGMIDMLIANAAFVADLMTVQDFAIAMLFLKSIQTVGNIYYRNITTEPLDAK